MTFFHVLLPFSRRYTLNPSIGCVGVASEDFHSTTASVEATGVTTGVVGEDGTVRHHGLFIAEVSNNDQLQLNNEIGPIRCKHKSELPLDFDHS